MQETLAAQRLLSLHQVVALCTVLHYISYGLQHQRNTGKGDQMTRKDRVAARFRRYLAAVERAYDARRHGLDARAEFALAWAEIEGFTADKRRG